MRAFEVTRPKSPEGRIVAPPPFDPNVSRTRVCIGSVLLVITFAVGALSSFFPAAKLWLFAACVLLIVCTGWILGLHRLRSHERDPRKLYGRQRIYRR
jgi:hypothetical protein